MRVVKPVPGRTGEEMGGLIGRRRLFFIVKARRIRLEGVEGVMKGGRGGG